MSSHDEEIPSLLKIFDELALRSNLRSSDNDDEHIFRRLNRRLNGPHDVEQILRIKCNDPSDFVYLQVDGLKKISLQYLA